MQVFIFFICMQIQLFLLLISVNFYLVHILSCYKLFKKFLSMYLTIIKIYL